MGPVTFPADKNFISMFKTTPHITILFPRLDLPNKECSEKVLQNYKQSSDVVSIRNEWSTLLELLKPAVQEAGYDLEVIIRPMWEFTAEFIESINSDLVLIPHRNRFELGSSRQSHVYYMQVMTKWLFSFDKMGWSAGSSEYPCQSFRSYPPSSETLERYQKLLAGTNQSKFSQQNSQSWLRLIMSRQIPCSRYIFFPCQIPHDHSIKYFSDYSELEIIESLTQWATDRKIHIVFKKHPANLKAMKPFEGLVQDSKYCRWSDASIYDLIKYSIATYTINSGVGFEALLLQKPVATFGRVEYDQVTVKATPSSLDDVYSKVCNYPVEDLTKEFSQFLNWYCNDFCIDLSLQRQQVLKRLTNKIIGLMGHVSQCDAA